jgi:hypothetical protein
MTHLLPALASAALLLSGTAAIGHQTAPAAATTEGSGGTTPAAKPKKEKKICRDGDANSYSHMPTRVCKTQAEWNKDPNATVADPNVRSADPNR